MATRQFILAIGQSQGGAVGERAAYEDANPQISVRNPAIYPRVSTYSRSATSRDTFTMPGSWPTKYQSFNLKGRATSSIKRWTRYNPTASFYDRRDVGPAVDGLQYVPLHTTTYPGYARAYAAQANDRQQIILTSVFQEDPSGQYVNRLRTGERLLIGSWSSSTPSTITLASSTPLDPPLENGEVFQLELEVGATAGTTTTRVFSNVRFGGYSDGGNQLAAQATGVGESIDSVNVAVYPVTWQALGSAGDPIAFESTSFHYRPGMRIRFGAGSTPGGLADVVAPSGTVTVTPTTTDYFVSRVEYDGTKSIVYISETRYGSELAVGGSTTAATGDWTCASMPQHLNSTMAGMRVRFTSGTMEGESYPLTDNVEASGNFLLQTDETMSTTPSAGDTFVIEPMPVNGEVPPWDEWGFFLPECRMNGPSFAQGPTQVEAIVTAAGSGVALSFIAGEGVSAVPGTIYEGARIRIYDRRDVTSGSATAIAQAITASGSITGAGQLLYAVNVNTITATFNVSTTYGGDPISDVTTMSAAERYTFWLDEHPDRGNTAPPGFNFDNVPVPPFDYCPYHGTAPTVQPFDAGASYTTTLAQRMHQHIGDEVLLMHLNISGTSLARRETYDVDVAVTDNNGLSGTLGLEHGWFDPGSLLDWAPGGEPDNCFAMLEKQLRAAKRVADAAGDSLRCLGVWNLQGEADAMDPDFAAAYEDNLRAFVREVRELLVSFGMWDESASTIPWWQPKLPTTNSATDWGGDSYVSVGLINTATGNLATEDPFFVTREITDHTISYDTIHYAGAYLDTLGDHAFEDWLTVAAAEGSRSRVDICNQALKNLGESKTITSMTDDTAAARLCNRYYDVALRTMLEAFPWPFATQTQTLTANTTNARSDVDWQYAYTLPTNFLRLITLGPDHAGANVIGEAEYAIEGDVLYCNIDAAVIRYVVKSPDPSGYSQHFASGLSHQLAAEIAPGLMQGDTGVQMATQMEQKARYYVDQAREYSVTSQRNADNNARAHPFDN